MVSVNDWERLYDREDVTNYLPFRDYDVKNNIYVTDDDGFGLVIECSPLLYPSSDSEKSLQAALQILPEDACVQFLLFASPNISNIVDMWGEQKTRINESPIAKDIVDTYKEFYEDKIDKHITYSFTAPVRNFRLVITVKIGGKKAISKVSDNLFSINNIKNLFFKTEETEDEQINDEEINKNYIELLNIKDRFIGSIKKAHLNPRYMKPNKLIEFHYEVLNMNHNFRDIPKWDGSHLNNFLFANDNKVVVDDENIIVDKKYIKTLSVKEYPEEWGIFDIIKYAGDTISGQNHSSPFLLSMNVHKLPESKGKDKITKSSTLTSGQNMPYAMFPKLKYIHKDQAYGMDKLQKGQVPYYFSLQFAIFGNTQEEVQSISGQTRAYFKAINFTMEEDNFVIFPALLSMLPLGYDSIIQEFLGESRGRMVFAENIVDLAPITAEWYGTNPQIPLISPRGQAFGLDLFQYKTGGFNGFTVGTTGSGKSVWMQWIALNYWLSSNKVWIIDIGGSYENLCNIVGGQYIEFKKNSNISLNPFTSIINNEMFEEYSEFLTSLFLLMGLPNEKTLSQQQDKLMKQYLLDAIRNSYDKYGSQSDVDTVVEELIVLQEKEETKDIRLSDFIKHLYPYRKGNIYGKFLNGASTIDFSSDMIVLESGDLEQMPDILNPILMVLTFQISKEIYLSEKNKNNQNKRNIVIMDEAHKFLGKSEHIEMFIEQAYRRFRKHGASMIIGTQGFQDLYGDGSLSKAGRVIIENSNWNFFLKQKSTSREKIKKGGFYALSDYDGMLMDSVDPVDKEYGEVLIMNDKIATKGRILLNEFLQAMLFTNAEEKAFIQDKLKEGYSHIQAVKELEKAKQRL